MNKACIGCPRSCPSKRTKNENINGFCRMPAEPVLARAGLHYFEEPCISASGGSGTVFFSGCSLKCVYCQNYKISHKNFGRQVSVGRLAEIFSELENSGADNINLVNPTHYYDAIKQALKIYRPQIPVIYNSSGYDREKAIRENLFDIYLLDLKYVSMEKSLKYSGVSDYFKIASAAVKAANDNCPVPVFKDGVMQKGLIVRHLVLPMSTNDSLNVIDWFSENAKNACFSLMAQYTPCGNLENFSEINRRITKREYDKVCNHLMNKDLKNVYVQELSSVGKEYIPEFDLSGV